MTKNNGKFPVPTKQDLKSGYNVYTGSSTRLVICRKCNHTHTVPVSVKLSSLVCGATYYGKRCSGRLKNN